MSRLALVGLVLCFTRPVEAQTISPLAWPQPYYPQIAQSVGEQGVVEVEVQVRADGTVAGTKVVQGPPWLREASVDAAKRTRFACRDCPESGGVYSLYVTFRIPTDYCKPTPPPLVVSPTQGWVTVDAPPPPPMHIHFVWVKVRGPRCLFLWPCEPEWGGMQYWHEPVRSARCLGLWKCGWSRDPRVEPPAPACPAGAP